MSAPRDIATVGDIVARDFRTAAVFERFGIEFCCRGRRSLDDACRAAAVDPAVLLRELDALPPASADDDVTEWPLDRLIDHVLSCHHTYARSAMPVIAKHLARLEAVHGQRHPELTRIAAYFGQVTLDLEQHMRKEEHLLFPYVKELSILRATGQALASSPFGTVENPIRMMEREHVEAADGLRLIRELTSGYATPADGGDTYGVCMAELDRFERDLRRHVHLENNVLFPRTVALERELGAQA